jgi:hypothetical protein
VARWGDQTEVLFGRVVLAAATGILNEAPMSTCLLWVIALSYSPI